MAKTEYTFAVLTVNPGGDIIAGLNKAGLDGWSCCGILGNDARGTHFLIQRPADIITVASTIPPELGGLPDGKPSLTVLK